jgi:Na+/H+-dicarboxylate symporter
MKNKAAIAIVLALVLGIGTGLSCHLAADEAAPSRPGPAHAALAGTWVMMLVVAVLFLGRAAFRLIAATREPMFMAFSTASTEAAFPRLIESLTGSV